MTTLAGTGSAGSLDGPIAVATFNQPYGVAINSSGAVFVAEVNNHKVRLIVGGFVSTFAGSGTAAYQDGVGTAASFTSPSSLIVDGAGNLITYSNNRVRSITPAGVVTTIAGNGVASYIDSYGLAASITGVTGLGISASGIIYLSSDGGARIRQLTCVPCPASYFCSSGLPVLCPAGSYCPLSSTNATLCPKGSFSNAGAASCTLCPAGTFTSSTGSTLCQPCPGGHCCPAGTSSWAHLNCGRGNYCPDCSGAPTPCPYQVPPTGGWGALQVQGPAFLVETARCLNHCFWNFTSGDGMLSKC